MENKIYNLPKGTVIHYTGIPCELIEDAKIQTSTPIKITTDKSAGKEGAISSS